MNFFLLLFYKQSSLYLPVFALRSQSLNALKDSSLFLKKKIQNFVINLSNSKITQFFFEINVGLWGPYKPMYTSCSLFFVGIIFFDLTILVYLFSLQALQNCSMPLKLLLILLMGADLLSAFILNCLMSLSSSSELKKFR